MRIGIRYCGGCNARYDRTAEVNKLKAEYPGVEFCFDKHSRCAGWLLVCGCPSACVSADGLEGEEIRRLSQRKDFVKAREWIRMLLQQEAEGPVTANGSERSGRKGQLNSQEGPAQSGRQPDQSSNGPAQAGRPSNGKRRITVGETASLWKRFSMEEVRAYAKLSLDENPIHTDPAYAAKGIFRRPVVHGVLAAGLLSSVMGTSLPGPGTVLLEESVRFLHPVYPEEEICARITCTGYEEFGKYYIGIFSGECVNQDGITVIEGTFRQMMRKRLFTVQGEGSNDKS